MPAGAGQASRRLLAKKPADRSQTPGEAAAALEPFATRWPGRPAERRLAPGRPALAALSAVCSGGLVVYRILTDSGELVITTESDEVEVVVKQGGELVDVIDTKTQAETPTAPWHVRVGVERGSGGTEAEHRQGDPHARQDGGGEDRRFPRTAPPARQRQRRSRRPSPW